MYLFALDVRDDGTFPLDPDFRGLMFAGMVQGMDDMGLIGPDCGLTVALAHGVASLWSLDEG